MWGRLQPSLSLPGRALAFVPIHWQTDFVLSLSQRQPTPSEPFTFAQACFRVEGAGSAGAGTLLGAVLFSVPAAIGDSLSGGGWALLGLLMSLGLGTLVMWDSIRQSIFWVAAVPFVGGLIAWVLSFVVLQFVLLTLLVVLQGLGLVSGMASLAPRFTDMVGSLMDQFHLSKSVASDASTVFGRGKLAESLERLEKR